MYLNILLKRKQQPTHHFTFNGSTTIKTDKEQVHRGFKDHKGLSYAFNGPTKPTTDNKLLYRGFTKNYKANTFNFDSKNDADYLNNFNLHPTTKPIELFTEYKNKYPNLTSKEYRLQTWQAEKGTPNDLDTFIKQDTTGRSIEDIKADYNNYSRGLESVQNHIKNRTKEIMKDEDYTEIGRKRALKEHIHMSKQMMDVAHKVNPVTIKPAIEKDEKYDFRDRHIKEAKAIEKTAIKTLTRFANKTKNIYKHNNINKKEAVNGAIDQILNNVDDIIDKKELDQTNKNANKIKTLIIKGTAKSRAEKRYKKDAVNGAIDEILNNVDKKIDEKELEQTNKSAHKITTAIVKSASKARSEKRKSTDSNQPIDTSDNKTVIDNIIPEKEEYKINQRAYKALLNKYASLNENDTLDSFDNEDKVKIKGLMKVLGIKPKTKILKSLRKKDLI